MERQRRPAPLHLAEAPDLAMTPLIDVVFLLLIFFMVTADFPRYEAKLDTSLPRLAGQVASGKQRPADVILDVTAGGRFFVDGQEQTLEDLALILKGLAELHSNQGVIIRGAKKARHLYIVQALNAVHAARIRSVAFAEPE